MRRRTHRALARKAVRRPLIALACAGQALIMGSAVAWWVSTPAVATGTAPAPTAVVWTGVVHDVGAAGVNLRSAPAVLDSTPQDTAARGSRLAITCGTNGDVVSSGGASSATWLRTSDSLYVSLLYVRVQGKANIASCAPTQADLPLIAVTDPSGPEPSESAEPAAPSVSASAAGSTCGTSSCGDAGNVRPTRAARPTVSTSADGAGSPDVGTGNVVLPTTTRSPTTSRTAADQHASYSTRDPDRTPVG